MSSNTFYYPDEHGVLRECRIGYMDVSNDAYHAGPGVSKSKLDAIAVSPLNYWDQYLNPDAEPRAYKHAFAVGDGTHKLVLEPGTFEQTYAVGFDKKAFPGALDTVDQLKQALNERGIPARGSKPELIRILQEEDPSAQIMAVLEAEHFARMAGKECIPAADYKGMLRMLQAVNSHHTAGPLLRGAATEQSFFWVDGGGVLRKCRTDAITADGRWIIDLKTTEDISEAGFGRTIAQRRYHVQGAWYLDILQALYGRDAPQGFAFIAAQKSRPHDVAVHYLNSEHLELGRLLYQRDLARLIECERTGSWPGSDGGQVFEARIPAYEMAKIIELQDSAA